MLPLNQSKAMRRPQLRNATRTPCALYAVRVSTKAEAHVARIERLIEKEPARCEGCMPPEEWREHREWA